MNIKLNKFFRLRALEKAQSGIKISYQYDKKLLKYFVTRFVGRFICQHVVTLVLVLDY